MRRPGLARHHDDELALTRRDVLHQRVGQANRADEVDGKQVEQACWPISANRWSRGWKTPALQIRCSIGAPAAFRPSEVEQEEHGYHRQVFIIGSLSDRLMRD